MVNETELRVAMIRKCMNMDELADAINISRSSLSYKMNNHREFTHGEIVRITEVLDLSTEARDRIFFGNEVAEKGT